MSTAAVAAIKAAILALTDESTRKKISWALVTIPSPVIVPAVLLASCPPNGKSHSDAARNRYFRWVSGAHV